MTLLLSRNEVAPLLDVQQAMHVLETLALEEAAGTTVYMPPFGGTSGAGSIVRVVGGGMMGLGRMGVRAGLRDSVALIWEVADWTMLAMVAYPFSHLRVGATMALAAHYLARDDARCLGLLGSGQNALPILQCMRTVRPIERIEMYSPTPEHRKAFAKRAAEALDMPVTAHDTPDGVLAAGDILVVATNSLSPVVTYNQLRPGVHVSSMGVEPELDSTVYERADQLVAGSRAQEIENHKPRPDPKTRGWYDGGPLHGLLGEGRMKPEAITQLGDLVSGAVVPRNGATDITVFRESRGGAGDIALANWAYERAKERGLGIEFNFG